MLGSLAAHEGRAGLRARAGDPCDDVGDARRHDLAARDVVRHEQRPRAHHDNVVDDHAHEILADGVVLVERLRDRDLGADAVGRSGEQGAPVGLQKRHVEETGEPADSPEDLGAVRLLHGRLHEFDGEITRCCIDSGFAITGGHGSSLPHSADARPRQ